MSKPSLCSLPITFRPWQRLYLDFLGPYPRTSSGNTSILNAVDHFSKFVLTKAVREATASNVVKFLENEIFFMFGVPEVIVTDNGKQFVSKSMQNLYSKYGIRHIFTAKYSPQANASERVNRNILNALRSYIKEDHRVWDETLCAVTCTLNNAMHETTQFSPHYAVFGQHAVPHGSSYTIILGL